MVCQILDLAIELQALITSHLGPEEPDKEKTGTRSPADPDIGNQNQNGSRDENESQGQRDLINLSSTCTFYRALLAPRIFRKITLRSHEKCFARVERSTLKELSFRNYVRELRFVGRPVEVSEEEQKEENKKEKVTEEEDDEDFTEDKEDEEETAEEVDEEEKTEEEKTEEEEEEDEMAEEEEMAAEQEEEEREAEDMAEEYDDTDEEEETEDEEEETDHERVDITDFMRDEQQRQVDQILPPVFQSLLSNLGTHFRNISTLSLDMNIFLDEEELEEGGGNFSVFRSEEDFWEAQMGEYREVPRALLAKVYSAIAANKTKNKGCPIKNLRLTDVMPRAVSTWDTVAWRSFLGQLESFEISIVGGRDGAGACINTLDGYHDFIAHLSTFFFDHLNEATSVTIRAPTDGPLGVTGLRHSTLPLWKGLVPKLKDFTLENCFIGPELIAFLVEHGASLESVKLKGCRAAFNGSAEDGIHWHTLFDAVAEIAPGTLRTFSVLPVEVSYRGSNEEDSNEIMIVERMLKEDKQAGGLKRCFAYASLDATYGFLVEDEKEVRASFINGEDQSAWERLMSIVSANNQI